MTTEAPASPAPESSTPAPSKAERRASLVDSIRSDSAKARAHSSPPPAQANTTASEADGEGEAAPSAPSPSKLEAIRKTLADKAAAQQQKREADAREREFNEMRAQLAQATKQGEPTAKELLAEMDRDPVGTLRKYGKDVRKVLAALTDDAIAPGSVAARYEAENGSKAAQEAMAEIEKLRSELSQRELQAQGERNAREYVEFTSDKEKYPLQAKLPVQRRLHLASTVWEQLKSTHDYDRDTVANYVEALLEEDLKHLAPTPPQSEVSTPKPPAAAKPPKTITPRLAAEGGPPRAKTKAERREEWRRQIRGD